MKNIYLKLLPYQQTSSAAKKAIIKFILKDPENIIKHNVRSLAKETYTSPSTIVRFCKNLGFEGFSDFKNALIYDVARINQNKGLFQREHKNENNIDKIIETVTLKNIMALQNSAKLQDNKNLLQAVEMIEKAKNVCIFAMGSSYLVAKDLVQKFMRIGMMFHVFEDSHLQLQMAKNMTDEDVALAISYSANTIEVVESVKQAKLNGSKVILISAFEQSELSLMSDLVLPVAMTEERYRIGAMSSRISQLNVVDILYNIYVDKNYEELLGNISNTYIKKVDDEPYR